jgi:hypothetical protein
VSSRSLTLTLTLLSLLILGPVASVRAEGEEEEKKAEGAELAINFPGSLGLTGMQRMVDARTPEGLVAIRGGVRYRVDITERTIHSATDVEFEEERHELGVYVGGSVLGWVDAAVKIPFTWYELNGRVKGGPDFETDVRGWGDMDAAAKVSIEFGPIVLAPYLIGHLPTGESQVEDLLEFEYGVSGTFSILNEYLSVHGNVAGLQREKGLSAIRYRVGAAFVIWADHNAVIRLYGYLDGVEFEGEANSDLNGDLGVQAALLEFITLELSGSVRVIDGGFVDEDLNDELDSIGLKDRHIDDEGTWSLQFAVGFLF